MAQTYFAVIDRNGLDAVQAATECLHRAGIRPRRVRLRARRLTRFHRERPLAVTLRDRDSQLVKVMANREGTTTLTMNGPSASRLLLDVIPMKPTTLDDGRNHGLSASPMRQAAAANLGDEEADDE